MEENVALDPKKQKKFNRSITGIKKLLKKKTAEPKPEPVVEESVKDKKDKKKLLSKSKDGKKVKKWVKPKGLVYLSHIPHGFYEHQMTQYFRQFGVVTNARVIKSKKTGMSKGCAFVEFREPAVAEIVAETMNNYLMGKRLIKAFSIPPKKQRKNALRKFWTAQNNPTSDSRREYKKKYNENKDDEAELKRARKLISNLNKTKKKLSELGITYEFTPVDIPEALIKTEKVDNVDVIKNEKDNKSKKNKKNEVSEAIMNKPSVKPKVKADIKTAKATEVNKKGKKEVVKVEGQKAKAKILKKPEEFITVQQEDDESDSSYQFDSDEYDKMFENEDEFNSDAKSESDESGADSDHDETEETDDEEISEEIVPKKGKGRGLPPPPTAGIKNKKKNNVRKFTPLLKAQDSVMVTKVKPDAKKPAAKETKAVKKAAKLPSTPVPFMKRRAQQKPEVSPKKPKFEKNNQKQMKKQFKKRK